MPFNKLHLIDPLVRAVRDEGYTTPTPIQEQAIPHVLAGKDLLACAQTGTGKTAAFALPILQRLHGQPVPSPRHVRVLVLAPTRELATQIGESFRSYGRHLGFKYHVIFGGVGQHPQTQALRFGVDIVIATPGRLLDLMQQGYAKLNKVEVLVLDEADRMLDMGFIHDVRKVIAAIPRKRQTLFFSATLGHEIKTLAKDILSDPVRVEVTPAATTVEKIAQSVCFVGKSEKFALLNKLLRDTAINRALVFTRTKHGANKLEKLLNQASVRADAIHGNKAQNARERSLEDFRRGKIRVLVATDIAARGIDVDGITHVFNYDLPNVAESYVHRIGRTARAGASGAAVSFCSPEERKDLQEIERVIRMKIPVQAGHGDLRREMPAPVHGGGRGAGHGGHGHHKSPQGHATAHVHSAHGHAGPGGSHTHAAPHQPAAAHAHGASHGHTVQTSHGGGHGHGTPQGHGGGHSHGKLRGRHPRGRR